MQSPIYEIINYFAFCLGTCILTPGAIKSSNNISHTFKQDKKKLILARCDDNSPRFVLSAVNKGDFVELTLDDETDRIILDSNGEGGTVHNHTNPVPVVRNFEFSYIGSKW